MIVYVNGDSHSAGAEAVNDYCFAQDDRAYYALGRAPHPDNGRVSYGCNIANELYAILHCDAESASSNSRIMRTTRQYIRNEGTPDIIIIGWATWEREEWLHDEVWWQVNAGGVGNDWPDTIKIQYQQYILDLDWAVAEQQAHENIYQFHQELTDLKIPHLFFNTFNHFSGEPKDWHNCYVDPYDPNKTYWKWLTNAGYKSNQSYHFGADAHDKWADFLYPHLTQLL